MARLLIIAAVLATAITLYGLFDCLLRDRGLIRVLPKAAWAIIILLVPVIGFVLWYLFGRGSEDRPSASPRRSGPTAPDDDEDYLRKVARDVRMDKNRPATPEPEDETPGDEKSDDSKDTKPEDSDSDSKGEGRANG